MSPHETQERCGKLLSFKSCKLPGEISPDRAALWPNNGAFCSQQFPVIVRACHSPSAASVLYRIVSLPTPVCGLLTFPTPGVPCGCCSALPLLLLPGFLLLPAVLPFLPIPSAWQSQQSFLGMPQLWITCHGNEISAASLLRYQLSLHQVLAKHPWTSDSLWNPTAAFPLNLTLGLNQGEKANSRTACILGCLWCIF